MRNLILSLLVAAGLAGTSSASVLIGDTLDGFLITYKTQEPQGNFTYCVYNSNFINSYQSLSVLYGSSVSGSDPRIFAWWDDLPNTRLRIANAYVIDGSWGDINPPQLHEGRYWGDYNISTAWLNAISADSALQAQFQFELKPWSWINPQRMMYDYDPETGTSTLIPYVPEPSAFSLLAIGLGGLAMMRRRRS